MGIIKLKKNKNKIAYRYLVFDMKQKDYIFIIETDMGKKVSEELLLKLLEDKNINWFNYQLIYKRKVV